MNEEDATGFGEFDDAAAPAAVVEWEEPDELDPDLGWRRGPNPLPLLAGAGGGLILGLALGVGAAALLGSGLLDSPPELVEAERVQADLDAVTVNLRGEAGERVVTLRAEIGVRTDDPDRITLLEPALRDSVLVLASDHSAEEILGASSRRRFRRELTERLDLLLGEDQISDLYLTELVVK